MTKIRRIRSAIKTNNLHMLMQLGYSSREIDRIAILCKRYAYLSNRYNELSMEEREQKSYYIQERNALDFVMKKAIDFTCAELTELRDEEK